MTDVKPFPFLRLPPELRNKVYEYVIGGHVIRIIALTIRRNIHLYPYMFAGGHTWETFVPSFDLEKPSLVPKEVRLLHGFDGLPTNWSEVFPQGASRIFTLSLICRQISHESRLLPWSTNIFLFANGLQPALDETIKTWNVTQLSTITDIAIRHCVNMDPLPWGEFASAHYLHTGSLRSVFPALKRVYICPDPVWTGEQKSKVMEELAARMLTRGNGEDEGLELVLMDPRNLSVDYHDKGTIKAKV